jgi:hypothetical protein
MVVVRRDLIVLFDLLPHVEVKDLVSLVLVTFRSDFITSGA